MVTGEWPHQLSSLVDLSVMPNSGDSTTNAILTGTFRNSNGGDPLATVSVSHAQMLTARHIGVLDDASVWTSRALTPRHVGEEPAGDKDDSSTQIKRTAITTNDIIMIVGVVAASGIVSFVTTAITCHVLMKRGVVKSGNASVSFARGRPPRKGWLTVPQHGVELTMSQHLDMIPGAGSFLNQTSNVV